MFLILSLSAVTVISGDEMVVNMPTSNNWEIGMTMDLNFVGGKPSPFTADSFAVFQADWEQKKENGDYDASGTFEMTTRLVQSQEDKMEALGVEASLETSFAMYSVCSPLDLGLFEILSSKTLKNSFGRSFGRKFSLGDIVKSTRLF